MRDRKMADENVEKTKRLMGALLRMPPKPHSAMKLKKPSAKSMTLKGGTAQSKKAQPKKTK
jgi:hypothetical protein